MGVLQDLVQKPKSWFWLSCAKHFPSFSHSQKHIIGALNLPVRNALCAFRKLCRQDKRRCLQGDVFYFAAAAQSQKNVLSLWIRLFRMPFAVARGIFDRQGTWRCSNRSRQEKSRELTRVWKRSLVLFMNDSVGRILEGAAEPLHTPRKHIHDFPVWSTFLPQIKLKRMIWRLLPLDFFDRQGTWRCSNSSREKSREFTTV